MTSKKKSGQVHGKFSFYVFVNNLSLCGKVSFFFLFRKELEELSVKAHQQVIQRQKHSSGEIAKDYVSTKTRDASRSVTFCLEKATDMTESAKFSDVHELEPSLQAICEAMWELIQ